MRARLQGRQLGAHVLAMPQRRVRGESWPLRRSERGCSLHDLLHVGAWCRAVLTSLMWTHFPHWLPLAAPEAQMVHAENHIRLHVLPELQAGHIAQGIVKADRCRPRAAAEPQKAS